MCVCDDADGDIGFVFVVVRIHADNKRGDDDVGPRLEEQNPWRIYALATTIG
jgi:hypothetical protein